ncbi:MAG: TolC family outer membrane protein [Burkholderiaceae bacterium]|nr:TolC family outer membrane protein [Burkholderiaceae bacterium]
MPRLTLSAPTRRPPSRLRPALLVTALGLALACAGAARAQSLQSLYEAAREYDAAYRSARAQADSVVFKAEQSRALRRPTVSATGAATYNDSETPYATTLNATTNQQSIALSAQQSLFNRANDRTIDQAERSIEVAQAQLLQVEQDLIVRVAQAYFDVLGAADALATVQTSKKATAEQLASAKRNFEVGTATITDTREAQAKYDLVLAAELAAENDLNLKRLALGSVVGRRGIEPKRMAEPVVLPQVLPAEMEEWVTRADEVNPSLKALRLSLDIARLEIEKAKAGHLPTVGVSASVTDAYTRLTATARNGAFSGSGTGLTSNVALQVNVPLFAGYSVENRVKETLSLEEKTASDLEAGRRSVAQNTRGAFLGVQSLIAQVKALEAAESSNKLAVEASELGYKVGVRVNIDVLNAQTQLFQTQRDLARARYDVIVNSLKLRQAAGLLGPQDVLAVDTLLAR